MGHVAHTKSPLARVTNMSNCSQTDSLAGVRSLCWPSGVRPASLGASLYRESMAEYDLRDKNHF